MNIAFILTGLGVGGAERQVCDLADYFCKAGHTVLIVSLTGTATVLPTQPGVSVVQLKASKTPAGVLAAMVRLRRVLRQFQPDVVHSHMVHANILVRLLRVFTAMPRLICTAHSNDEGGKLRMWAYRCTDSLADLTTNVSQAAVQEFIEKGASREGRIVAVYNGIDTQRFSVQPVNSRLDEDVGAPFARPVLLAVGRLAPPKDYPTMLQAMALLKEKGFAGSLVIVGDGELRNELIDQADRLGLAHQVHFLGTRHDIPELMNRADLFVLSSAQEGFGLVVAEAMACELPVVATFAGGIPEVVGDCGFVVPSGDPAALAVAIQNVLDIPHAALQALGERARKRVQDHYSIDAIAQHWLRLYRE